MSTFRPRVLFVASNPPMDTMGSSLLFYRHFVERDDYELFVVTDHPDFSSQRFPYLIYQHPPIIRRLVRTRLALFAHDFIHLFGGTMISRRTLTAMQSFRPDVVAMAADTWISNVAVNAANKLSLPLIGYFMDWPTYAVLGHRWVKRRLSLAYRRRYQMCDLAFGICPEMLEALGAHPNAHVFYPSARPGGGKILGSRQKKDAPFVILFAGNLGQWYGKMLLRLASRIRTEKGLRLCIAGRHAEWTADQETALKREGIYLGFLKGGDYKAAFENADALVLIMGFGEENRLVESTSFKSKLVDYLASGLPLIIWGPEYCTAVRHARREEFAEVVTVDDPEMVVAAAKTLAQNPARAARLVENGSRFWKKNLNADEVMPRSFRLIESLVRRGNPEKQSQYFRGKHEPRPDLADAIGRIKKNGINDEWSELPVSHISHHEDLPGN